MKTTPLLMTGGNVRLIQQDLKTNTRRVWTPRPGKFDDVPCVERCPYGKAGDILAIRETFWCWGWWEMGVDPISSKVTGKWHDLTDTAHPVLYDADAPTLEKIERTAIGYYKRPSIYLPMTAWRIKLEITRIEVERLQDISEVDAKAEGCRGEFWKDGTMTLSPIAQYSALWDSINFKKHPWSSNPVVWSLHFKKLS